MLQTTIQKQCRICKQEKFISEFYKDPNAKDGFFNHCKGCHYVKTSRYARTEKGKKVHSAANRKYLKSKGGARMRLASCQKYRKTAQGRMRELRYRQTHQKEIKARAAVTHAVRSGTMAKPSTKPCHCCPKQAQTYHHFLGYLPEHWLSVIPVCTDCHYALDNKQLSLISASAM